MGNSTLPGHPVEVELRRIFAGTSRRCPVGTVRSRTNCEPAASRVRAGPATGQRPFELVVAGPGFEPGKAKPTVLQTAPFGRSGNLPDAAPQDGTVKDSGPSGCLRHVHASAITLPAWPAGGDRGAGPGATQAGPGGRRGQCRPVPRPRGQTGRGGQPGAGNRRHRRLREGEDDAALAEQRPASGEPVRPPIRRTPQRRDRLTRRHRPPVNLQHCA